MDRQRTRCRIHLSFYAALPACLHATDIGRLTGLAFVLPHPYNVNILSHKPGAPYDPPITEFIVWPPSRSHVELILVSPMSAVYPMQKDDAGYWHIAFPAGKT